MEEVVEEDTDYDEVLGIFTAKDSVKGWTHPDPCVSNVR